MLGRRIEASTGFRCWRRPFSLLLALLALALCNASPAQTSPRAQDLLARHEAMQAQLAASPMGRPLTVESEELPGGLRGEVFAVVDQPFAQVVQALSRPGNWCDMLLLHVNNRRCRLVEGEGDARSVELAVVRRYDLPVESAFILKMAMRIDASAPDYLLVELGSDNGPMGTSQHRVQVEAVPLPAAGKTFLHFSYAYQHTTLARLASQAYLATFGRSKVGFTDMGQGANGPDYIRGLRGLVERNAVRYFFTVDAYLDAMAAPPAQQPERRLAIWYAATERYPRQLQEFDRPTYLALKRSDRAKMQAAS